jgi:hypothetical protein
MRAKTLTVTPVNTDTVSIAASQMPGAAGALTLTASPFGMPDTTVPAGPLVAHKLNLSSDADDSGHTYTIVGLSADGVAQTETGNWPNTATAKSTKYFSSVKSVSINAAATGNLTVGVANEFVTQLMCGSRYATGFSIGVHVTGTINYTVQMTVTPVRGDQTLTVDPAYVSCTDTNVVAQTADKIGYVAQPIDGGFRLVANSYSNGATAELIVDFNELIAAC